QGAARIRVVAPAGPGRASPRRASAADTGDAQPVARRLGWVDPPLGTDSADQAGQESLPLAVLRLSRGRLRATLVRAAASGRPPERTRNQSEQIASDAPRYGAVSRAVDASRAKPSRRPSRRGGAAGADHAATLVRFRFTGTRRGSGR